MHIRLEEKESDFVQNISTILSFVLSHFMFVPSFRFTCKAKTYQFHHQCKKTSRYVRWMVPCNGLPEHTYWDSMNPTSAHPTLVENTEFRRPRTRIPIFLSFSAAAAGAAETAAAYEVAAVANLLGS